jgi:hypothetical protein
MALTSVQSNNKSVAFRGRHEREPRPTKKAKKMPAHMRKRGLVSEKAAKSAGLE